MAKKAEAGSSRQDPKQNKSLAIRKVYEENPKAKAKQVIEMVKELYGHSVNTNLVYMTKTKMSLRKTKRKSKAADGAASSALKTAGMATPADWVKAIKLARELIEATGSYATANALLKAVEQ